LFSDSTRLRRIVGDATVTERSGTLRTPIHFGGREYPIGVRFRIERLAPRSKGVELSPLVSRLASFPDPSTWSARMRRALVPLIPEDAELLSRELERVADPSSSFSYAHDQAEFIDNATAARWPRLCASWRRPEVDAPLDARRHFNLAAFLAAAERRARDRASTSGAEPVRSSRLDGAQARSGWSAPDGRDLQQDCVRPMPFRSAPDGRGRASR
jgi:hypothetical protein